MTKASTPQLRHAVFTARRYASAVGLYADVVCPFVRLSVCHKQTAAKNFL